jgi:membrane protease subunit (stomatin/prohibitin family)
MTTAQTAQTAIQNIVQNHPAMVSAFLAGDCSYDMDSFIWDYYFDNGTIRNYDCVDVSSLYEQFESELMDALHEQAQQQGTSA